MKKRFRKKNHKNFISEIRLDVSLSLFYRRIIFNLKKSEQIILNKNNIIKDNLAKDIVKLFNKFDLSYTVECEYVVDDYKAFFIFKSYEFPSITKKSCNYKIEGYY